MSAHKGDYGNHAALHFVISENTKAAARQRLVLGAAFEMPHTLPDTGSCRSELAREKPEDAAFIQKPA